MYYFHSQVIAGEGMPYLGSPFEKGRLFILFQIDFPHALPEPVIDSLSMILPKAAPSNIRGDVEVCGMADISPEEFGKDLGGAGAQQSATDDAQDSARGMPDPRVDPNAFARAYSRMGSGQQCQNM